MELVVETMADFALWFAQTMPGIKVLLDLPGHRREDGNANGKAHDALYMKCKTWVRRSSAMRPIFTYSRVNLQSQLASALSRSGKCRKRTLTISFNRSKAA